MDGPILILGGGVIGLSIGITLLERAQPKGDGRSTLRVVLAAEHLPQPIQRQLDIGKSQTFLQDALNAYPARYASVWAGAHHVTDTTEPFMGAIVRRTFDRLVEIEAQLAQARPPYSPSPLIWVDQVEHFAQPVDTAKLFHYYPEYRVLDKGESSAHSCAFRTLDIDTRTYLPWLQSRFTELGGVVLPSPKFTSITDALGNADVQAALSQGGKKKNTPSAVIVATGHYLSKTDHPTAAEVEEAQKDYTLRGQVLRVRAPWRAPVGVSRVNEQGFRDAYVIPFADGTAVVGGTRVPADVDPGTQEDVTEAILARVLPLAPDLRTPSLQADPVSKGTRPLREQVDIFAVGVGLRPSRRGGPRIELDGLDDGLNDGGDGVKARGGSKIVWCYGFGGTGYQSSWGAAEHVAKLLEEAT